MSLQTRNPFGSAFYIANTMEIFERLAWYGFFALSSLYMTSPQAQGGLGFTDQERGFLQGMIPFLLYLFPVITGALADNYGYKRMFILSFVIMCPSYYLLGQVTEFWSFCAVFLAVAVGAACFKPVVVGTVGKVTDNTNRGLGFGIFYTMVNIGGFLGPLVAGYVRVIGWDMVFIMSSLWIAINFIPAIFFYKEPSQTDTVKKSLKEVLREAQLVLGNGRLAMLVIPIIIGLMVAAKGGVSFSTLGLATVFWLLINLIWSKFNSTVTNKLSWYQQNIMLGNKQFVVYLLIMTGFWTMYLQLFITTPLYIRDFVNTSDLVTMVNNINPDWLLFLAGVNIEQLSLVISTLANDLSNNSKTLEQMYFELVNYKVMVPLGDISSGITAVINGAITNQELANQWATQYLQINPEYIVNLDFGAIVLFQIFVSKYASVKNSLSIIIGGTLIVALSLVIGGLAIGAAISGIIIVGAVVIFAFGEMLASPKSQEYVAAIAPKNNTAMYMGYYFVSLALGNLFAGLLSGWAYGYFAKQLNQPLLMWSLFAIIGIITAFLLLMFNKKKEQI